MNLLSRNNPTENNKEYNKGYQQGYKDATYEIATKLVNYRHRMTKIEIAQLLEVANGTLLTYLKEAEERTNQLAFNIELKNYTYNNSVNTWALFMDLVKLEIPLSTMYKSGKFSEKEVKKMIEIYNKYAINQLYPYIPKGRLPTNLPQTARVAIEFIFKHRLGKYGKSECLL